MKPYSFEVRKHRNLEERVTAARKLVELFSLPPQCQLVADCMDNNANVAYGVSYERVCIVQKKKIAYLGGKGPFYYNLKDVQHWLEQSYGKRGKNNSSTRLKQTPLKWTIPFRSISVSFTARLPLKCRWRRCRRVEADRGQSGSQQAGGGQEDREQSRQDQLAKRTELWHCAQTMQCKDASETPVTLLLSASGHQPWHSLCPPAAHSCPSKYTESPNTMHGP
ncbi:hypothetical protein AOLI_G00119330 [Acnodon oligacanthus]